MSGWKVTSIFGSLINYSVLLLAMEIAKLPNYDYCAVLGDDIDVGFNMPI